MIVNGSSSIFNRFATPAGIQARVIVKDMFDRGDDQWPDRFMVRPVRGDSVQSSTGRRLSVLDVVHGTVNGEPILQVEIGVDRGSGYPIEGGSETAGVEGFE